MTKSRKPFQRSGNHDPKLALLRKADTERDTAYSIGGRTKLATRKPISLAPVPAMETAGGDGEQAPKEEG